MQHFLGRLVVGDRAVDLLRIFLVIRQRQSCLTLREIAFREQPVERTEAPVRFDDLPYI